MAQEKFYVCDRRWKAHVILHNLIAEVLGEFTIFRENNANIVDLHFTKWAKQDVQIRAKYSGSDRNYIDVFKLAYPGLPPLYQQKGTYKTNSCRPENRVVASVLEEHSIDMCNSNSRVVVSISTKCDTILNPFTTQVRYYEYHNELVDIGFVDCEPTTAMRLAQAKYPKKIEMYRGYKTIPT